MLNLRFGCLTVMVQNHGIAPVPVGANLISQVNYVILEG